MEPLLCYSEAPRLLIFSEDIPRLLFYSHFTAIISALAVGAYVCIKNRKSITAKLLMLLFSLFSLWAFVDVILWATNSPSVVIFWWSIQILVEPIVYAVAFYLFYSFVKGHLPSFRRNILAGGLLIPLAALIPTQLTLQGVFLESCDALEGPLALYYTYFLEVFFIFALLFVSFKGVRRAASRAEQMKIIYFAVGIIIFLLAFTSGNIIGSITENWDIAQYGLFGMPIFIAFLGYLIVRFKAFSIKVFATKALVWALWIMIGSILFVAQTGTTKIVTGITEVIAVIFGIMLIRSVGREVAQREQLERLTKELAEKNAKLEELDKVKSQFLSFASHDLKSPMNIIKQFASLILDKTYATPEKITETVAKIKLNAERGIGLVEDFLDFRKIEEGKMEYAFERKNLVALVRDLTEDFKVMAREQKNINVTFVSKQQEIPVLVDVTRFNQVIQNLLSNSLKYTEKGSIDVVITEEQHTALITVHDTGLGIKPEVLATLFEQFHRDPGVAKKINGTGLGLYIAKQIVLGHGGEIWAHSDGLGLGSTFSVRVKKAQ